MKKIAKFLFAAIAMTAAVSCVKELTEDFRPAVTGNSYVFTATLEADTKTVLDENTMENLWLGDQNGNEYITVVEPGSANTYVAKGITAPTKEATFEMAENGGTGLTGKSVFAVYPAGAWTCFNNADSLGVNVTYANLQNAYPNTYDPKGPVAVAYNADVEADQNFAFKNVSALLKFNIQAASDPVYTVTVSTLGGEPISGAMVLKQKGDKGTISGAEKGALNWVELSDVNFNEFEKETSYYIAVAPALLKKGIAVQLNKDEVQTYTITKEIALERNKIYDLGGFSYKAPEETSWYLVGNYTDGNVNSIKKTLLERLDGTFYKASAVEVTAGQAFKLYNPSTSVSYYADGDAVVNRNLAALTEAEGFGTFAASGIYDIYVSYRSGNDWQTGEPYFEFKNVYLVNIDPNQPTYAVPTNLTQLSWYDEDYGTDRLLILGDNLVTLAKLVGNKWILENEQEFDIVITPFSETSGEITWGYSKYYEDEDWTDHNYTKAKYSNLTSSSVDLISLNLSSTPDAEPVFDAKGEYVMDVSWNGVPIGYTEDWETYEPVTCDIMTGEIELTFPNPEGKQLQWTDYDTEIQYVLDFGMTAPGKILKASCSDNQNWYIEEEWAAENGFVVTPKDVKSGEITWKENGKTYVITYSDYDESGMSWDPIVLTCEDIDYLANGVGCAIPWMPCVLTYPCPDNMQLEFEWAMAGGAPAVIDLGLTTPGYLSLAFNWEYAYDDPSLAPFRGWYMSQALGADPYGWPYEVIPTDMTSGVFRISSVDHFGDIVTTDIAYFDFKNDGTSFTIDGTMFMESEELTVTPAESPYNVFFPGITPMPGSTPEGKQWTWVDDSYGMVATKVFDFAYSSVKEIYVAEFYNDQFLDPSTGDYNWPYDEETNEPYFDESKVDKYIYYESYKGYTVTPTDETSGIVTFTLTQPGFDGQDYVSYFRLEYSELTDTSVKIFSPWYFVDEDGNDLVVTDPDTGETLEQDGWPLTWGGLGIGDYDEEGKPAYVTMTVVDDPVEVVPAY